MKKQKKPVLSKPLLIALTVLTAVFLAVVMNSVGGISKSMLPEGPVKIPSSTATPTAEPTAVPTPTPEPSPRTYATLSKKLATEKREDVVLLQNRLKELGFYTGEADGYYRDNTFYAVLAFQRMNGIDKDGIAGPGTQQALFEKADVLDASGRVFVPFHQRTPTPAPTATPTPAVLPMSGFSAGRPLDGKRMTDVGYTDSSVSAKVTGAQQDGGTLLTVDLTVSHPSQLRSALSGTVQVSASMDFRLLSSANNAVIALPGPFYRADRSAAVLNGKPLRNRVNGDTALAVFSEDGTLRVYSPAGAKKADLSRAYQAFCVPSALVISGMVQQGLGEDASSALLALGQTEGLHYVAVRSEGVSEASLAAYLKAQGCENAYLAGKGNTAVLYSGFSALPGFAPTDALSVDSILYFASVSEDPT